MLTVVAAAAIGGSCSAGNKVDVESGAVGEYSIIELRIRVAKGRCIEDGAVHEDMDTRVFVDEGWITGEIHDQDKVSVR